MPVSEQAKQQATRLRARVPVCLSDCSVDQKGSRRVEDGNQGEGSWWSGRGALREKRESLFVHQQPPKLHARRARTTQTPQAAGAFWCGRDLFPNSATCVSSEARVPRLPPKHRAGPGGTGLN